MARDLPDSECLPGIAVKVLFSSRFQLFCLEVPYLLVNWATLMCIIQRTIVSPGFVKQCAGG
jgi:hypothetical protein